MQKSMLVFVLSLACLSCAHKKPAAEKDADPAAVEQVRKRAVVDLACEDVKVDVLERGSMMRPWTFAAAGCGKTASYLSRMGRSFETESR